MRLILPLLILLAVPAAAQNADWKKLGRPLDDGGKSAFMNRYVYLDQPTTDKNVGVHVPVLSQSEVTEWVKEKLGQVMTMDGVRYPQQIAATQPLFTPTGYADYAVYLQKTGMEKFLKENNFKVVSYVEGTPQITGQGVRDVTLADGKTKKPIYLWQVQADLVLSYLNYRNEPPPSLFPQKDKRNIVNRFPVTVRLELMRIPMQQNNNLVAVNRISFTAK